MKKLALIFCVGALLTAFSSAQFRMAGGGAGAEYFILTRKDVRKDLKITPDEATKLDAAQSSMRDQMRQVFQDSQGDRDAMQAGIKKLMDGLGTTIKGILTPDQQKRLHEINIQMQGSMAVTDPDTQKELKMTDDQVKQVKDLQAKQQEANQSLFQKVQDGELDRTAIGPMMQKNTETLKADFDKLLTAHQKDQLKAMGGAHFDQDPNEQQGFGRPRGGGAGGGGGGGN